MNNQIISLEDLENFLSSGINCLIIRRKDREIVCKGADEESAWKAAEDLNQPIKDLVAYHIHEGMAPACNDTHATQDSAAKAS